MKTLKQLLKEVGEFNQDNWSVSGPQLAQTTGAQAKQQFTQGNPAVASVMKVLTPHIERIAQDANVQNLLSNLSQQDAALLGQRIAQQLDVEIFRAQKAASTGAPSPVTNPGRGPRPVRGGDTQTVPNPTQPNLAK